jgi:hypothetical protein
MITALSTSALVKLHVLIHDSLRANIWHRGQTPHIGNPNVLEELPITTANNSR